MRRIFLNPPASESFAGVYLAIFSSSIISGAAGEGTALLLYIVLSCAMIGIAFSLSVKRALRGSEKSWPYIVKIVMFYAGGLVFAGWSRIEATPVIILAFTALYIVTYPKVAPENGGNARTVP